MPESQRQHNRMFWAGVVILAVFLTVAVFAPLLAPCDPAALGSAPYLPPSPAHPLGTNDIGQDILSELIYGTRTSLVIGVVCAAIITSTGAVLGMMAGLLSPNVDRVIGAAINVALSVPGIPLTLVMLAYLGNNLASFIACMCVTAWAGTARVVRARTMQLRELPFIKIERAMGASSGRIMFHHILPNLSEMVLVRAALSVGGAMMTETSLSFLGIATLGQKSWGSILHYAFFRSGVMAGYWWWYMPPIICISLCILSFTLLGYVQRRTGRGEL